MWRALTSEELVPFSISSEGLDSSIRSQACNCVDLPAVFFGFSKIQEMFMSMILEKKVNSIYLQYA